MIDDRMYTFLELCDVMHYRKTAERRNMTQPAVTQHIQYLEKFYQCKLFEYSDKKLKKTKKCLELEQYTRQIIALEQLAQQRLTQKGRVKLSIGATKSIGEYTMEAPLMRLLKDDRYELHFVMDNTENLLERLRHFQLDLLLLEGYVDKTQYAHKPISKEEIVGICSLQHPFAYGEVALEDIFREPVVLREQGSGTRAVFERFLLEQGYGLEAFQRQSVISSNQLIASVVARQCAISFVYGVVPEQCENLATFRIKEGRIFHEFHYVYLHEAKAKMVIGLLEGSPH